MLVSLSSIQEVILGVFWKVICVVPTVISVIEAVIWVTSVVIGVAILLVPSVRSLVLFQRSFWVMGVVIE